MKWKSITGTAAAAAIAILGAQYFFGSHTAAGAVAVIIPAMAAGLFMNYVHAIGKSRGCSRDDNL